MALLILKDGKRQIFSKPDDEARLFKIWQVKVGNAVPDSPELARYAESVSKVILNWKTAPEEYVRHHLNVIVPQAVAEWIVDSKGHPIRPSTHWGWEFARKYGLMRGHSITNLVTKRQVTIV